MMFKEIFAGSYPRLYFRSPLKLGFEHNILISAGDDVDDVYELALIVNGSVSNPTPSLFFEGVELKPDFVDEDDLGLSFRYEKAGLMVILYIYASGVVELTVW